MDVDIQRVLTGRHTVQEFKTEDASRLLTENTTFEQLTLEDLMVNIRAAIGPGWIDAVADRYLGAAPDN